MDWQKIYSQLIEKAKTRQSESYSERHHILPKCLGGSNSKNNIVSLTGREHFIAHKILVLLYPDNASLKFALWAMCNQKGKHRKFSVSSRDYERARQACIPLWRQPKSEEHKQNLSRAKLGKKLIKNQRGKDNHNFNKIWITNTLTQESKMVPSTQDIQHPWVKGRVKVGVLGKPQTKGRKWYYDPNTNIEKLYEPGKQPQGWSRGRLPKAV
jgi:hypothetical protein